MPIIRHFSNIGTIEEDQDERRLICPYCEEHFQRRVYLKVKETVELQGVSEGELERLQLDAARWRQCPVCHSKWKIRTVAREEKDIDLPWESDLEEESGKDMESVFGRDQLKKRGRLARRREENQLYNLPKDPDVLKAIRQGKDVTNYTVIMPE